MKRTRKIWLTVTLSAVFALAAAGVLAACGKSKQPISLTLDAGDGGSLATTTYTLPEGDDLSAFLADKEPSPIEGLTFAGWYLGGELIEEGDTMPATATTLTAKYTADCTVLLYTEGEAEGEFGDPQTLKKSGIYQEALDVGDLITIPEGYSIDEEKSDARTVTSLGAATTVSVYLVRNTYTLRFVPDLPAGAEVEADDLIVSARHGMVVAAPDASSFDVPETLRLLGWATEEGGEVLYEAGDEIPVSGALVLHGVWIEGYTDLYGGDDIIFFSGTEENVAYLVRGGMEFEGVHTGDEFRFVPDDGEPLEGKVIGHSFAYTRSALEGTYTYYSGYLSDVDDPIIETETLVLDGTFNATYTHVEEGETVVDKGIYYPGESRGEYILETDDYAYTFILSEAEGKHVFSFYDIAEGSFNMGVFASVDGYFSIDEDIYLELDGFGGAAILDYVDYVGYYGKYDIVGIYGEEVPEIHAVIEGYGEIECILVPLQSGTTVFVEKDLYAGTYNTTADGKDVTIELSGYSALIGATITEGTNVTADAYWVRESEVFGTLVDIYDGDKVKYTYLLVDEGGELSLTPFEGGHFTEYIQLDINQSGRPGLYYPTILLYDEVVTGDGIPAGAKRAEVYSIVVDSVTGSRTLTHAATGYYTVRELGAELNYYTYTQTSVDEHYTGEAVFETIGCLTGSVSATSGGSLDVYYIFEADNEDWYILLTEETEEETGGHIWYREVGITGMGSLYVTADGTVYEGSISAVSVEGIEDTIYMDLQAFDTEARAYIHFYFVVHVHEGENVDDDPTYTYIVAEDAPHTYEYSDQYGDSGDGETLFVDGAGFAIYADAEGNEIVGTYEETGTTVFGDTIYTFTATTTDGEADPESFDFILYFYSTEFLGYVYEEAYFYLYDEGLNGTLTGEGGIELELDGFYYWAEYTDADGVTYSGNYFLLDEDYICFMDMEVTGDEFYFIVEGKTITLDGDSGSGSQFAEYYEVVDDSYLPVKDMEGYTVIFDEDGTVTLYDADDEEVGTGKWTLTDEDDIYDVVLTMGETKITWTVQLIADDYYMEYLCVLCNEEMEGNFVGPGLSVLYMDGFGYGSYIDEMGSYYDIYTTVVNDKYLFISEYNGDFEYFVSYNVVARTFKPVDNSAYYATFYSTDLLGSVVFADGLYLDGELYGYYVVEDGAEKATVFVQDETEAYVEEEFTLPKDSQTYVLDGVTYYRWNEGEEIAIDGTALFHSGEIELAVTLTFTPDGTAALNAPASITYQDEGGQDVTVDGFELVIELDYETYELVMTLYDANRIDYPVYELTWNPDDETENTFIVIGTFLYTDLIEDYWGDDNGIYYGHFALGDIAVSEDQYWIVLEATDLNEETLGCFVDDLNELKTQETSQYYGTIYEAEIEGTDENTYVLTFFLITEDEQPWTGSGTPYMLIYAVSLDQMIDGTDGINTLVLYTSTYVFVNAFSNVLEVGETNVGLYLRLSSGGIGYLEPDDAIFADDGSWIIWGDVPNGQSTLTWLLNLTIDEETGLITAFTATQGDYGYFGDTTTTYAVGFFYTISRGDDGESLVLNEILVYSMGNIQDGRVYPFDDMTITENDDGTWTVETADATYTVTIKLNDTQNGFNITVEEQTKDAGAGVQG